MPDFGPRWIEPKKLETGGQGITYVVRDSASAEGRTYVAKILNNPKGDRKARFLQEIEVTKSFSHPNVVRSIDSGETKGSGYPYFVMPYYKGGTLANSYSKLGTPLDRMRLFRAICEGVAYAHAQGLVHRDLKPDNVFISEPGHPVVGDFGLCYRADEDIDGRKTMTSEAVGARKYMPPEWREGRTENPHAAGDVYSLGKILYWLFEERVYDGHEDDHVSEHALVKKNGALENQVPKPLDRWLLAYSVAQELIGKTVLKRPEGRLQSARELVQKVQAGIDRIELGGRVLDFNLAKPCVFCGEGTYQLPPNCPFPYRRSNAQPGAFTQLTEFVKNVIGIGNRAGGIIPIALVCHICGNIQYFRLDLTEDREGRRWNP